MASDNETTETGEWVEIKPSSADVKLVMSYENLRGSANYQSWHNRTIKALKYFGLWSYVTGDISMTDAPTRKAKDVFTHNEFKAYLFITSKLDTSVDNRVQSCKTASELWKKLETQYKLKGSKGQTEIIYKWSRVKLSEGGNVGDYLAEHDEIRAQADELGLNLGDTYSALQLLLGLPPSWDGFRQTVETGAADREEELDFDHISELILQEDVRRSVVNRGSRNGKSKSDKTRDRETDEVYSVSERDAICYRCGYKGHFSFNCKTKPENFKPVVESSRQPNHSQPPYNNSRPYPNRNYHNNTRAGPSNQPAEAKVANDEPLDFAGAYSLTKSKRQARHKDRNTKPLPRASGDYRKPQRTLHLTDVDVALMAGERTEEGDTGPFLVDSGASNHICGDRSLFTDLRPHRASVSTADKTCHNA